MNILNVFLIFMITTSLTLAGFAFRQRKNNRLLGELLAKDDIIQTSDAASKFGVSLQGGVQVIKCSDCAEWVKLEAMVCRYCGKDVSETNKKIIDDLRALKKEQEDAQLRILNQEIEERVLKRENRKQLIFKFMKNMKVSIPFALVLLIAISALSLFVVDKVKYSNIPEKVSRNIPYATEIWKNYLNECGVTKFVVQSSPRPYSETYRLDILLMVDDVKNFDWDSSYAKQIDCFTEKAVGFKISESADWDGEVDSIENASIDIYTDNFGTPALVFRSSQ